MTGDSVCYLEDSPERDTEGEQDRGERTKQILREKNLVLGIQDTNSFREEDSVQFFFWTSNVRQVI